MSSFLLFLVLFLGNFLAMIAPWSYSPKIFLLILRHMHAKIVARQQKVKNSMSMDGNMPKNAREQTVKKTLYMKLWKPIAGLWPFLARFWNFCAHFHSRTQILSFYCIATNFMCMCVRINCKNLGTRPLKGCYWFSKFHVQRNPAIAHFKGSVDLMPYCERCLIANI